MQRSMVDLEDNLDEAEKAFESQYEKVEPSLLGEGTYGKVFKAKSIRTGELVAMKQMKIEGSEDGMPSTALREIALLKELKDHQNIVKLINIFYKPNKLVLVFEFVENDLKKYMRSMSNNLSPATVKNFAFQLFQGVQFCHANRILHRDLKPQNLLIDQRLRLKIADFGLARPFHVPLGEYTHEVVTVWYRPPEILLGSEKYSLPVDLWSIGCVMAEMATGSALFPGDSEISTIFKIFQRLGTPTEQMWPEITKLPYFKPTFPQWPAHSWAQIRNTLQQVGSDGADLLDKLTYYDPRRRISAFRALQHPYFRDVDPRDYDA